MPFPLFNHLLVSLIGKGMHQTPRHASVLCLNSVILFSLHKGNKKELKIGVPDFGAAFVSIDASFIYVVVDFLSQVSHVSFVFGYVNLC